MNKIRSLVLAALSLGAALSVKANVTADPTIPAYAPTSQVTGAIPTQVPPHLQILMTAWMEGFKKVQPGVTFAQTTKETDYRVCAIGIGPNVNEIFDPTFAAYLRKNKYDPFRIVGSMGGLTLVERPQATGIYVNPTNPVKQITLAQLDAIYSSTRYRGVAKAYTTWGQLGATGEWADKPIHPYMRGADNRVSWYFRDQILLGGLFKFSCVVPGKSGGSDEVVTAVANDPYGISFGAVGYMTDKVKALEVGETEGKYGAPTEEDVAAGKYPLARTLELYVNRKPGKALDPVIKEFLSFVLSKDGQDIVAADHEDGFLPIPARMAQILRGKLEQPQK